MPQFVDQLLKTALPLPEDSLHIQWAHWASTQKTGPNAPPRSIIINFQDCVTRKIHWRRPGLAKWCTKDSTYRLTMITLQKWFRGAGSTLRTEAHMRPPWSWGEEETWPYNGDGRGARVFISDSNMAMLRSVGGREHNAKYIIIRLHWLLLTWKLCCWITLDFWVSESTRFTPREGSSLKRTTSQPANRDPGFGIFTPSWKLVFCFLLYFSFMVVLNSVWPCVQAWALLCLEDFNINFNHLHAF